MCDVCGGESGGRDVGVAAVPSAPVSVMWCENCLRQNAVPRFVVETWLFSEFEQHEIAMPEEPPERTLAEWALEMTIFLEGEYVKIGDALPRLWREELERLTRPKGWIGVDLDGTLAVYNGWQGHTHIGEPIAPMVAHVQRWLAEGHDVRIVTARVSHPEQADEARAAIETWCQAQLGRTLTVTHEKDYGMIELYDDRAVQVEQNTGRIIGHSTRGLVTP